MRGITIEKSITNIETETLRKYFREILLIKQFESPEQEMEVAIKARNGDEKAKEELIKRNLRFVISVAKKYVMDGVTLSDLINEGNVGLISAANRYDPTKGVKFISYAVFWIRKVILEFLLKNGRTIRLPLNKYQDLVQFDKNTAELEQKNGGVVDIQEVLAHYGSKMAHKNTNSLRDLSFYKVSSLDKNLSSSEDSGFTLLDTIEDADSFPRTDQKLMDSSVKTQISTSLNSLIDRDREVVELLFGINGKVPMSYEEVGAVMSLSSERIRQIKKNSLKKLKTNKNVISAYSDI